MVPWYGAVVYVGPSRRSPSRRNIDLINTSAQVDKLKSTHQRESKQHLPPIPKRLTWCHITKNRETQRHKVMTEEPETGREEKSAGAGEPYTSPQGHAPMTLDLSLSLVKVS